MPNPKMLILRGNWAPAGNYPDEKGNANVAWPLGALHVQAASGYARLRGYEPVVLDKPGQPQSQHSPQATAVALRHQVFQPHATRRPAQPLAVAFSVAQS